MAGLDPAIHALLVTQKDVDARVKPAHDDGVSADMDLSPSLRGA
jgi:hypothetical protein